MRSNRSGAFIELSFRISLRTTLNRDQKETKCNERKHLLKAKSNEKYVKQR